MKQSRREKRWAYAQAWQMDEVRLSRETGRYPNRDYAAERCRMLVEDGS